MATKAELEAERAMMVAAIAAMCSVDEGSVGLKSVHDLGGRVEQGQRPRFDELVRRLKEIDAMLNAIERRGMKIVTDWARGLR
jgi:hypothetical protein